MVNVPSRTGFVGFWFAAVAIAAASVALAGVPVSLSTTALLLTMCLVPPAILLFVSRGAAPPTVGELLYAVDEQKGRQS
jgi:hypothetical protein